MAFSNAFDLLGDDTEDINQLALAFAQKVQKAAVVQPPNAAMLPTKPPSPSQAVKESRNGPAGGRGGGSGGRGGFPRGGRGGYYREIRNNDAPRNENGFSGGYRSSDNANGARRDGYVGGYGGGREGGRRGGFADGESGDDGRPRRTYDRRSGTGRSNDLKREGGGRGNWGTTEDDIPPATEETTTAVEKSPVAEKQWGDGETSEKNREGSAEEKAKREAEAKKMTLEEYEKIQEEKKKALQATKVEERKVDTKVFESMQQLSNKKTTDEEIFIKLGAEKEKRKDASEKSKKSLSISEFLKPADGKRYNPRGGYRGRGGRDGYGQRSGGGNQRYEGGNGGGNQRYEGGNGGGNQRYEGGNGGGNQRYGGGNQRYGGGNGGGNQRYGGGNGGGNQRYEGGNGGAAAPVIEDTAQFPSLGK